MTFQLSQAGRVVTLVAVSQGNVYYCYPGDTTWTLAINNTGNMPPLNFTGIMFSAANSQKLWFADGVNWIYFNPLTTSVETWSASAGSLPVDSLNNTPRLICTWRGRTVLSGLIYDPSNIFFSKTNDPTNFDYFPTEVVDGVTINATSPTQALALNVGPQGLVGDDIVTSLVPYSDDILVIGGDHSIRMLAGDPMENGHIDLVSDVIGMAWGQAWCKDPYGTLYFVSNKMGMYTLVPGQKPVRISQPVEQVLQLVDTGNTTIRLIWNDKFQGLHVFLSPTDEPAESTHLFWEQRSGSWFTDQLASPNFDPLCCCIFDGNLPDDRTVLIGSWDGFIRTFKASAVNDDGLPFESDVVIGPLLTQNLDEILLKDIQGILAETSGDVTYSVYTGTTAELALSSEPVDSGTWEAGRNSLSTIRVAGYAVYVRLTSTNQWAMEAVRARIATEGKVRRRGT